LGWRRKRVPPQSDPVSGATQMALPTGIRSVTSKSIDAIDITAKSHQIFHKGLSPKVDKNPRYETNHSTSPRMRYLVAEYRPRHDQGRCMLPPLLGPWSVWARRSIVQAPAVNTVGLCFLSTSMPPCARVGFLGVRHAPCEGGWSALLLLQRAQPLPGLSPFPRGGERVMHPAGKDLARS
jgi:hypothetical protein